MTHACVHQSAKKPDALFDVILEICGGFLDGFADIGQRGKMDAGFDFVFPHYAFEQGGIADTTFVEWHAGINGGAMTSEQIIEHDNFLANFAQSFRSHAADVACSARHKNRHDGPYVDRFTSISNSSRIEATRREMAATTINCPVEILTADATLVQSGGLVQVVVLGSRNFGSRGFGVRICGPSRSSGANRRNTGPEWLGLAGAEVVQEK